ncbi:MAG: acyl carrier protein [Candidatus Dormibacteraceae bacterium]
MPRPIKKVVDPIKDESLSSEYKEVCHMPEKLDFRTLQEVAAEILGVDTDQVQLNVSFQRDLAADSLDLVELISVIEDKYDVELPEEELENMKNVGDLWKFLTEARGE